MGIRIDSLTVAYDDAAVIEGLSLTIEPGSFFTLLGPSGCGKTTLLRTIAGFVRAVGLGPAGAGRAGPSAAPAHTRSGSQGQPGMTGAAVQPEVDLVVLAGRMAEAQPGAGLGAGCCAGCRAWLRLTA